MQSMGTRDEGRETTEAALVALDEVLIGQTVLDLSEKDVGALLPPRPYQDIEVMHN